MKGLARANFQIQSLQHQINCLIHHQSKRSRSGSQKGSSRRTTKKNSKSPHASRVPSSEAQQIKAEVQSSHQECGKVLLKNQKSVPILQAAPIAPIVAPMTVPAEAPPSEDYYLMNFDQMKPGSFSKLKHASSMRQFKPRKKSKPKLKKNQAIGNKENSMLQANSQTRDLIVMNFKDERRRSSHSRNSRVQMPQSTSAARKEKQEESKVFDQQSSLCNVGSMSHQNSLQQQHTLSTESHQVYGSRDLPIRNPPSKKGEQPLRMEKIEQVDQIIQQVGQLEHELELSQLEKAELEMQIAELKQSHAKNEAEWVLKQQLLNQELREVESKFTVLLETSKESMQLKEALAQERQGRLKDEQTFHDEIIGIIREFEGFHKNYATLEKKHEESKEDFLQFVLTLKQVLSKLGDDLSEAKEFTLHAPDSPAQQLETLCQILQQKADEIQGIATSALGDISDKAIEDLEESKADEIITKGHPVRPEPQHSLPDMNFLSITDPQIQSIAVEAGTELNLQSEGEALSLMSKKKGSQTPRPACNRYSQLQSDQSLEEDKLSAALESSRKEEVKEEPGPIEVIAVEETEKEKDPFEDDDKSPDVPSETSFEDNEEDGFINQQPEQEEQEHSEEGKELHGQTEQNEAAPIVAVDLREEILDFSNLEISQPPSTKAAIYPQHERIKKAELRKNEAVVLDLSNLEPLRQHPVTVQHSRRPHYQNWIIPEEDDPEQEQVGSKLISRDSPSNEKSEKMESQDYYYSKEEEVVGLPLQMRHSRHPSEGITEKIAQVQNISQLNDTFSTQNHPREKQSESSVLVLYDLQPEQEHKLLSPLAHQASSIDSSNVVLRNEAATNQSLACAPMSEDESLTLLDCQTHPPLTFANQKVSVSSRQTAAAPQRNPLSSKDEQIQSQKLREVSEFSYQDQLPMKATIILPDPSQGPQSFRSQQRLSNFINSASGPSSVAPPQMIAQQIERAQPLSDDQLAQTVMSPQVAGPINRERKDSLLRSSVGRAIKDYSGGGSGLEGHPQLVISKGDTVVIDDISLIKWSSSTPKSQLSDSSCKQAQLTLMRKQQPRQNKESQSTARTNEATFEQLPGKEVHAVLDLTKMSREASSKGGYPQDLVVSLSSLPKKEESRKHLYGRVGKRKGWFPSDCVEIS